jgi:hypothetical protein
VDVLIRQAHPGRLAPPHRTVAQKIREAELYKEGEGIPWAVVADSLDGRVHNLYGRMADPTYIIDRDGVVAFQQLWTHVPTLERALEALLHWKGRGVATYRNGVDARPHGLRAFTRSGQRALLRGAPQSYVDLVLAMAPLLVPVAVGAYALGRMVRRRGA